MTHPRAAHSRRRQARGLNVTGFRGREYNPSRRADPIDPLGTR